MFRKALVILGFKVSTSQIPVIRKVKHSDKPALTHATHGTVLLKGKIEEYV